MQKFVETNHHCRVPKDYHCIEGGLSLSNWVEHVRRTKNTLTEAQKQQLQSLGFFNEMSREKRWNEGFAELVRFHAVHHHCRVLKSYQSETTGFCLGRWVNHQREQKASLDPARISKLDALGFDWQPVHPFDIRWEKYYDALRDFYLKEGHCRVPKHTEIEAGQHKLQLGTWVYKQRQLLERRPDRMKRLGAINFEWHSSHTSDVTSPRNDVSKRLKPNDFESESNDSVPDLVALNFDFQDESR